MSGEGGQPLSLQLEASQVHPFPFLGSVVEVSVEVRRNNTRVLQGADVPFQICLQDSDDSRSARATLENAVEVLNPLSQVVCGKSGRSPVIKVRLLQLTNIGSNVVLTAFPAELDGRAPIAPSSSPPMRVVRHRLEITNEQDIKTEWFKDEGGKSNQIVLHVRLIDERGQTVANRRMKLKCELLYEDGEKVPDQSILTFSNDTSLYLNADGHATINCRIENVSKKHEKRKFKVTVSPDTIHNPTHRDVSDHETPGIYVKSKISGKNRRERAERMRNSQLPAPSAPNAIAGVKRSRPAGDEVRSISPLNMIEKATSVGGMAGGGDVVGGRAAEQFSKFAVEGLQRLRQQLQLQACSSSPDLDPSIALIEHIIAHHSELGMSSTGTSGLHVSFDDAHSTEVSSREMVMQTPHARHATMQDDSSNWTSFRLQPRSSELAIGPDLSREDSLFTVAAGAVVGPGVNREHSFMMMATHTSLTE